MATVTLVFPKVLGTSATGFTIPITLSSKNYTTDFTWDNRATNNAGAWRVNWKRASGEPIFSGKKLVLTDDFFEPFHYLPDVPEGRLQIRRADNTFEDPGLLDLAGAVLFEYITD